MLKIYSLAMEDFEESPLHMTLILIRTRDLRLLNMKIEEMQKMPRKNTMALLLMAEN